MGRVELPFTTNAIKYFNNLPKDLENYPMKFFWYLAENDNLSKFLCLFDKDDLDKFKGWISFILFSGIDPFSFLLEGELLFILEKIDTPRYISSYKDY